MFAEWRGYFAADFREVRADRRAGELWALIANKTRNKGDAVYRWTDLFPEHRHLVRSRKPVNVLADAKRMVQEAMAIGGAMGFKPAPKGKP